MVERGECRDALLIQGRCSDGAGMDGTAMEDHGRAEHGNSSKAARHCEAADIGMGN